MESGMNMKNISTFRAPSERNAELLYLLTDGVHVKVGRTKGKICRRVSALQTGSPRRINAVVSVEIPFGAIEAESYCHRILRPFHTVGEWFKCSVEDGLRALVVSANPYLGSCWLVHDLSQQATFKKVMKWHRDNWHGVREATDANSGT
jgi:hypothetical protein